MAFIQPDLQFNPDTLDNLVIGIAADMGSTIQARITTAKLNCFMLLLAV